MKKKLSLLLAIVMVMSFMLVGCSTDIKGTWVAKVDFTDMLTDNMTQSSPTMAHYVQFSGLTIDMVIEIEDDENYTLSVDEDSVDEFLDKIVKQSIAGVEKQLGRALSDAERKVYDQQFRKSLGNVDDLVKGESGTYTFEDDKLVLEGSGGSTKTFEYFKGELSYVGSSGDANNPVEDALKEATFKKK